LIKQLQKSGWEIELIKGSHYIMIKDDKTEVIPYHNKDMKIGTLSAILKRTGLKGGL